MMSLPETVATSPIEGDPWVPFVPHTRPPDHRGNLVHAIKFADGSIWDAYNGWRVIAPQSYSHWGIHG